MDREIVSKANWLLDPMQVGRIGKILRSNTTNFTKLVEIAELDKRSDFIGINLDNINFGKCNLTGFNFNNCSFRYSDISRSRVDNSSFKNADFLFSTISIEQKKSLQKTAKNIEGAIVIEWPSVKTYSHNEFANLRLKYGISINSLAESSGFSSRTISRYLAGEEIKRTTFIQLISSLTKLIEQKKSRNIKIQIRDLTRIKYEHNNNLLKEYINSRQNKYYSSKIINASDISRQLDLFSDID